VLARPQSPNRRPLSRVVSLVSIGPVNQSSWVSGDRRGGSMPVGAAPKHGEAPRDLPVAKEVEQRGFLERFVTQRIAHRIAGEFSLSAGSFSQNHHSARAGCPRGPPCARAGRALLGHGGEGWAALSN
jgi:hypothetical protein